MYIITNKETNEVCAISLNIDYLSNGYPFIAATNTSYYPENFEVHEIVTVPENVEVFQTCYTENDGFYDNPYQVSKKPYGIPDDLVEQIKNDAITEVQQEVTSNANE